MFIVLIASVFFLRADAQRQLDFIPPPIGEVYASIDAPHGVELVQEDQDMAPGGVDLKISFKGAFKESTVTEYAVYESRMLAPNVWERSNETPLVIQKKFPMGFPVMSGPSADLMDIRLFVPPTSPFNMDLFRLERSGDIWGGGYGENEDFTCTLTGPGSLIFMYIDIDKGDKVTIDGHMYGGYTAPMPISFGKGQYDLRWQTDGITNEAHGGFILNWIPENQYEVAIVKQQGFVGPFLSVVARNVVGDEIEEMSLSSSPFLTGEGKGALDRYVTTIGPTTSTSTTTTRSTIEGGYGSGPGGGVGVARGIRNDVGGTILII